MAAKNVKELLKKTRDRRKAEITLSTGEVIEMYWVPLSEAENDAIQEAVASDSRSNAYGYRVLIKKAEYADGTKMFSFPGDLPALRNEYAKTDTMQMMLALIENGGVLAKEDPKSDQGGDQK
jgi:hypothetical protein